MKQSHDDSTQIEAVVLAYKTMVHGIILTHIHNIPDRDDVFQDVFLAYFQSKKDFRDDNHKKAWLIRTTLNLCKKANEKAAKHKALPLESVSEQGVPFTYAEESDLYLALRGLPTKYLTVIHLFYFEELSVEQIAQMLRLTKGAVRVRLNRGRAQLRTQLQGGMFDEN